MVALRIPKKSAIFTGTGDLFTAVYLAWSEQGVKVCMYINYIPLCVECIYMGVCCAYEYV